MSQRARRIFGGVLLLVAAGIVWWLVDRDRTTERPASPSDPSAAAPAQPVQATGARAPDTPAPTREQAASEPPDTLRIRVADIDQRPLADVVVEVRGEDEGLTVSRSDEGGIARTSRLPTARVTFFASQNGWSGRVGWTWSSNPQREVTLRMRRDRSAEILVVDPSGTPVGGVAVGLYREGEAHIALRADAPRTGDDGVARIDLPGYHSATYYEQVFAAAFPAREPARCEAQPWNNDGPNRFVVQLAATPQSDAHTILRVHVVDETGAPHEFAGRAQFGQFVFGTVLGASDPVEVTGSTFDLKVSHGSDPEAVRILEHGRLPSALELHVPPAQHVHEVTVQRGKVAPVLEVPLVRSDGTPVTEGEFGVFLQLTEARLGFERKAQPITPDDHGLLHVVLDMETAGQVEVSRPHDPTALTWPAGEALPRPYSTTFVEPPAPTVLGVREFHRMQAGERFRLPPVVTNPIEPLLSGRVVTADGSPAGGAKVLLTASTGPDPKPIAEFEQTADERGRFVVRGTALDGEFLIMARRPLAFAPPTRCRRGDTDIELVLQATGSIAVEARAAPHLAAVMRPRSTVPVVPILIATIDETDLPAGFGAFLRKNRRHVFGRRDTQWQATAAVRGDRDATFADLLPGRYTLQAFVTPNPVSPPIQVVVRAGETTHVAELRGAVVGRDIELREVRVTDAAGKPLSARVRFMLPSWTETLPQGTNEPTDERGIARFLVPRNAVVDLEVVAEDLAPRRLAGVTLPIDVVMSGGATLDVSIDGLDGLAGRAVVSVTEVGRDQPTSPVHRVGDYESIRHPQALLHDGRARVEHLPRGRYVVWLCLRSQAGTHFVRLDEYEVTDEDGGTVDVRHTLSEPQRARLAGN